MATWSFNSSPEQTGMDGAVLRAVDSVVIFCDREALPTHHPSMSDSIT